MIENLIKVIDSWGLAVRERGESATQYNRTFNLDALTYCRLMDLKREMDKRFDPYSLWQTGLHWKGPQTNEWPIKVAFLVAGLTGGLVIKSKERAEEYVRRWHENWENQRTEYGPHVVSYANTTVSIYPEYHEQVKSSLDLLGEHVTIRTPKAKTAAYCALYDAGLAALGFPVRKLTIEEILAVQM